MVLFFELYSNKQEASKMEVMESNKPKIVVATFDYDDDLSSITVSAVEGEIE